MNAIDNSIPIALLLLAITVLVLAASLVYLFYLVGRAESDLRRLYRSLHPEVPRDINGNRIHERL